MAAGGIEIRIDPGDMRALRKLMNPPTALYGDAWQMGMSELATKGVLAGQRGAPVETGKLQGSMRGSISKAVFPIWAKVTVRARATKTAKLGSYPYPRLLEFSRRHGHFKWLVRAVMPVWNSSERTLEKIGDAIERRWESAR